MPAVHDTLTANQIRNIAGLEDHDDLYGRFDFAGGDDDKLLDFKYENAKKKGLVDHVLEHGILSPIDIHVDSYGDKTVTDGHHRLAIALKHFPDRPIPVRYWKG